MTRSVRARRWSCEQGQEQGMAIGHRSVRCSALMAAVLGEHAAMGVDACIFMTSNPMASTSVD